MSKEQEDGTLGEETLKKSMKAKKENVSMGQQVTRVMSPTMSSREVVDGCLVDGGGTTNVLKWENRWGRKVMEFE